MRGGMRGRGRRGYNGDATHYTNERSAARKAKNKTLPRLSPRGERFKKELLGKIVPWEKITESLENFPYYVDQTSKALLMECVLSHLRQKELTKYCGGLLFSSVRILLQSIPDMGRYLERLMSALARELQLPLLKFGDCCDYYDEEEEKKKRDVHDYDFDNGDGDDDDDYSSSEKTTLKRGVIVEVFGFDNPHPDISIDGVTYSIPRWQKGEVYEVDGDRVAVVFNIFALETITENDVKKKNTETSPKAVVIWFDVEYVRFVQDKDVQTLESCIAIEALYEVLASQQQPLIVYFPNPRFPASSLKKLCNQLPEDMVIIRAGQWSVISDEMEQYPEWLKPYIQSKYRPEMCKLFTNIVCMKPPTNQDLFKSFIKQIEEDKLAMILEVNLRKMHKVLEDSNLSCTNLGQANIDHDEIMTRKSVKKIVGWATNHYLTACGHPRVNEEKVDIPLESIKLAVLRLRNEERGEEEGGEEEEKEKEKEEDEEEEEEKEKKEDKDEKEEEENEDEETQSKKRLDNIKNLARGEHGECLAEAVVCSEDIGLKFDDVGVVECVKKKLYETVILPMRRPELFSIGSLRPCQGLLLYGPPGTGKSLVAKALASESGAYFINITAAVLASKGKLNWFGYNETLSRVLFSYASKLAPIIIFVDEDDYLLGGRGHINKYDTRILNEFMAAWDALKPKVSQRILVVAATNRPYDLDDAVIRRLQRRIYVGLPDVENRSKIVKILLKKENLVSGFSSEQLAEATQGYSGSDLKKLCVAAAYRPVAEFLEQESNGERVAATRPLDLNDFIHSKAKVRPSVAHNSSSMLKLREWKEQYGEPEIDI